MKKCLLVLTRFPTIGKVKTRLAQSIGDEHAADIQKGMLLDILNRFSRVKDLTTIIVHPNDEPAEPFFNLCSQNGIPQRHVRTLSGVGGMNEDIVYGYEQSLVEFQKVALMGSDIPHYTELELDTLFSALDEVDVVYHPSADDGCCPHGLRKFADLWTGNNSRTPGYIQRWEEKAKENGLSFRPLSQVFDIDRIEDLELLAQQYPPHLCPFTMEAFQKI